MNEDPLKYKQEQLVIIVEIAKPEDWQVCKELRLMAITGTDAKMFGVTSEKLEEEKNKSDEQ